MSTTLSTVSQPLIRPSRVVVQEVRTRQQRDVFVRFPWQIYRHDPHWVPPLLMERKEFISPRHPFYQHGAAAMFLACQNGQPVGRVLVSDDSCYNEYHGSNTGCFGMFESIDDQEVAHALLDAAANWLLSRGRATMWGPIDYSMNYTCGLLIDGFDSPPRVLMNHNPPYYAGLIESYGLAKVKDLYAWWFDDPHNMLEKWHRRAERIAETSNVTIRTFRLRDMNAELRRCKTIYNESWAKSFGFVPMTDAEFLHYGKELKHIAVPEMLCLAEVDGEPVAFSMTLPDFNEAMKPLNGRLTKWGLPLGLLKFQRGLKHIRSARLVTLGITEPYRRRGIAELLILRTLDYGRNVMRYTGAELSWTLEDNDPINHYITAVGGQRYKTYRLYEKQL